MLIHAYTDTALHTCPCGPPQVNTVEELQTALLRALRTWGPEGGRFPRITHSTIVRQGKMCYPVEVPKGGVSA